MVTTLFLQSEMQNPFQVYETMLTENPVYWDNANQLWAIYSYDGCTDILNNPSAHIPAIDPDSQAGLNEHAVLLLNQFARFSNGALHETARLAGMLLYEQINIISINDLLEQLLSASNKRETDWVDTVCRKLPIIVILKSYGFGKADCDFISDQIEHLVKLPSPTKTPEQVKAINAISKQVYDVAEKHLLNADVYRPIINTLREKHQLSSGEAVSLCVSNLVGLFIQSYDACRGLLSNSLLQILTHADPSHTNFTDPEFLKKSVTETLRYDPPVHNTRRVAAEDILLVDNTLIKKGSTILIVLAAANRDPKKFNKPGVYGINRPNNMEHLTFGAGGHACLAKHFSTSLTVKTLACLFELYKNIKLIDQNITYEPVINVRLPKSILIDLSPCN